MINSTIQNLKYAKQINSKKKFEIGEVVEKLKNVDKQIYNRLIIIYEKNLKEYFSFRATVGLKLLINLV